MKIKAMLGTVPLVAMMVWMLAGAVSAGRADATHQAGPPGEEAWAGLAGVTPTLTRTIYLPTTTNNFCHDARRDFFDDFSDANSGWIVGEDDLVRVEYLGGEYRVLTKDDEWFYPFPAPTCPRRDYIVEVDVRWAGKPGSSYGLTFGMQDGYDRYYSFEVNTDYQAYGMWRWDGGGWTDVAPVGWSPAIHSGMSTNHLKVSRIGAQIMLEVNGAYLGSWYDNAISGFSEVGIVVAPYFKGEPSVDARFDNFRVTLLNNAVASEMEREAGATDENEEIVPLVDPFMRDRKPYLAGAD